MVYIRENPTKMDDLGVPLFEETSICGQIHHMDQPLQKNTKKQSMGCVCASLEGPCAVNVCHEDLIQKVMWNEATSRNFHRNYIFFSKHVFGHLRNGFLQAGPGRVKSWVAGRLLPCGQRVRRTRLSLKAALGSLGVDRKSKMNSPWNGKIRGIKRWWAIWR